MNTSGKIVTDLIKLRKRVPVTEFRDKEAEVLAAALFTELSNHKGLGLSANQLGIDKRICVINVKQPFFLVNPQILDTEGEKHVYVESCLSLPRTLRKPVRTLRFPTIKVKADNYESILEFGPDDDSAWEEDHNSFWGDEGMLESVVVQHEIDHLDGITIKDRQHNVQHEKTKKYERNKKYIFMSPDGDTEFIKYKYGQKLLEEGWTVQ